MAKIIDNLPKLSPETTLKKAIFNSNTVVDNFTVKKCPLMDNFENIDSSIWHKLNGSPFKFDTKQTHPINARLLTGNKCTCQGKCNGTCMNHSTYVLADSSNNTISSALKSTLPAIHGITTTKGDGNDSDSDDSDDENNITKLKLYASSKLYIGALSIVGLFILYRAVKKNI